MNVVEVMEEKITISSPPPPPIQYKRKSGDGDKNRFLTAALKWEDKYYNVECRSRKLTPNFYFHNAELGEVVFAEDQITLLYSQKELDPEIYKLMRIFIKCWIIHCPEF